MLAKQLDNVDNRALITSCAAHRSCSDGLLGCVHSFATARAHVRASEPLGELGGVLGVGELLWLFTVEEHTQRNLNQ